MKLTRALRVADRDVIAIAGGGGKTSLLYRLADELAEPGHGRVLILTTAKMLLPSEGRADGLFIHRDFDVIAERLEATLPYLRRIAITPDILEAVEGWKMESAPLDWPGRFARLNRVANVIVEADGARRLPFKAPADYEPPIPLDTNLVIYVVGLDALGQPLDDEHVHRAARVAALTGQPLGSPVTLDTLATVLTHPQGARQMVPEGARLVALLNKADDAATREAGRALAARLLQEPRFERVLVGSLQADDPITAMYSRVGAVVLAAGGASRFGAAKQTLPWQDTTLVGHALRLARASGAVETVLVVGAHAGEVEQAVDVSDVTLVHNPAWAEGLSGSVRAGLNALSDGVQAALFLLADQPAVTPAIVQALVQRYVETAAPIVVATYAGRRGNPTLFDRALWDELRQVTGDQGGRSLIEKYQDQVEFVEVGEAAALDVDTPEDYRNLMAGND